jgi:hypothetical protein
MFHSNIFAIGFSAKYAPTGGRNHRFPLLHGQRTTPTILPVNPPIYCKFTVCTIDSHSLSHANVSLNYLAPLYHEVVQFLRIAGML